jgi:hypothetical protein
MTELLSDSLEIPMSWRKRWAMKAHLLMCGTCRRYRQQLLFIDAAIKNWDGHGQTLRLSNTAKRRIKEKLPPLPPSLD